MRALVALWCLGALTLAAPSSREDKLDLPDQTAPRLGTGPPAIAAATPDARGMRNLPISRRGVPALFTQSGPEPYAGYGRRARPLHLKRIVPAWRRNGNDVMKRGANVVKRLVGREATLANAKQETPDVRYAPLVYAGEEKLKKTASYAGENKRPGQKFGVNGVV